MFGIAWLDYEIFILIGVSAVIVFAIQSIFCFTAERRWVKMLPLVLTPFALMAGVTALNVVDFVLDFWGSCGWGFFLGEFVAWGVYLLAEKLAANR